LGHPDARRDGSDPLLGKRHASVPVGKYGIERNNPERGDGCGAGHTLSGRSPNMEIGLAWHIQKKYGSEIVLHSGGTFGYHSFVGWDRETGLGVVVLSNSANDIDDIGRHLLNPTFELAKLELTRERKEITLSEEIYESYVEEYEVVPTFVFTVTHEPEGLYLQATGQPKSRIFAEAETEFFSKIVDAQISF
jgi:D-alanyl-D-alanine-carboxypeptidase/D-alanyl-D-alanine-endopeptidase